MASLVYAAGPNLDLIASILLQPLHKNRNNFVFYVIFIFFSETAAEETASRSHAHGAIIASLAVARSAHNVMNIGGPRRALKCSGGEEYMHVIRCDYPKVQGLGFTV